VALTTSRQFKKLKKVNCGTLLADKLTEAFLEKAKRQEEKVEVENLAAIRDEIQKEIDVDNMRNEKEWEDAKAYVRGIRERVAEAAKTDPSVLLDDRDRKGDRKGKI